MINTPETTPEPKNPEQKLVICMRVADAKIRTSDSVDMLCSYCEEMVVVGAASKGYLDQGAELLCMPCFRAIDPDPAGDLNLDVNDATVAEIQRVFGSGMTRELSLIHI